MKPGAASQLVKLFVERAGGNGNEDPHIIMERLVAGLSDQTANGWGSLLERASKARHVVETRFCAGVSADGYIEPIGKNYDDGFQLTVSREIPEFRQRFTIAHEICHTFFYELVPELKFAAHNADPWEERLCNSGAAALLIPNSSFLRNKAKSVSLQTLDELAAEYEVSVEAMFIRLRRAGLWRCRLGIWHRMTSGDFVVDQIHGSKREEWRWTNSTIVPKAWSLNGESIRGRSALELERPNGSSLIEPAYFEMRRANNRVMSLIASKRDDLGPAASNDFPSPRGNGEAHVTTTASPTPKCVNRRT